MNCLDQDHDHLSNSKTAHAHTHGHVPIKTCTVQLLLTDMSYVTEKNFCCKMHILLSKINPVHFFALQQALECWKQNQNVRRRSCHKIAVSDPKINWK